MADDPKDDLPMLPDIFEPSGLPDWLQEVIKVDVLKKQPADQPKPPDRTTKESS